MSKILTLELFRCCRRMKEPSDDNKGEPRFCHMYQTLREITVMLNISFELFLVTLSHLVRKGSTRSVS